MMATMCFSISCSLSIWNKGGHPKLTESEAKLSAEMGRLHLLCYGALSSEAEAKGQLLFKVRPKHHYFIHLLDELTRWKSNPMGQSNFVDEDSMKHLRGLSLGCHASTVRRSWGKRYVLKQVLLWRRLQLDRRKAVKKQCERNWRHVCSLHPCWQLVCFTCVTPGISCEH